MIVTVTNSLGRPDGIASISLVGSAQLTITGNTCPSVVAAGASCTLQITYVPPNVPSYDAATLAVAESSGAQTQVPVTGEAVTNGP
jgi:hypothetical protein